LSNGFVGVTESERLPKKLNARGPELGIASLAKIFHVTDDAIIDIVKANGV